MVRIKIGVGLNNVSQVGTHFLRQEETETNLKYSDLSVLETETNYFYHMDK